MTGPRGPAGPAGPSGSKGGLKVVDGVGTEIGSVTGLVVNGSQQVLPVVVLQRNGVSVALLVFPDHFEGTGAALSYESLDCTGAPLLTGPFDSLVLPATVEGPSSTVYVPDTSLKPQSVVVQSMSQLSGCVAIPMPGPPTPVLALPAMPLVDLSALFSPPFRVP